MSVALCDRCAPLLGRPELDTPAKLAIKLCLACKARAGAAFVGTATRRRAKVSGLLLGAVEAAAAGAVIVATVDTAAELVTSTLEQLGEAVGLEPPKRRRRRRRKAAG